jgi:ABC-type polysaccharide/polyol phosphate transport system ATPase subunit
MEPAIRFDHVSKKFTLHHRRARSFQELALSLFRGDEDSTPRTASELDSKKQSRNEEFWALRDVSFSVEKGETVGLIGPNGAGKSTALKLVSRIIEPTLGTIEVNGRVGALLELGAGFHPDLSGRENIYLNGSILGLRRAEIERKIDDIIAFAELERFIDMPVKHYSSGMHVRLGFSIAVYTDPEILLVDEVLAVGDESFQQKCMEKLAEFQRGKCTVLLVSHNLQRVQDLCTEAVWMEEGRVQQKGDPSRVITNYVNSVGKQIERRLDHQNKEWNSLAQKSPLKIRDVKMMDLEGNAQWEFRSGEPIQVHILYESRKRVEKPVFSILIHRSDGLYVSSTNTYNIDPLRVGPIEGLGKVIVDIAHLDLYEGDYFLSVGAYLEPDPPHWSKEGDFLDKDIQFRVTSDGKHGVFALPAEWKHYPDGEPVL